MIIDFFFFFQAEDGIRGGHVTGVQTCALPICRRRSRGGTLMSEVDPNARLWDLLRGAMATKAFGIAADLEVADALAGGPRSVAKLAKKTGADAGTLYRILRALASDGVFAEEQPGVFSNSEASELLRKDQPGSWPEFAHLFGAVFYDAVATMDARSGGETFAEAFGTDFWAWLEQHPAERSSFD